MYTHWGPASSRTPGHPPPCASFRGADDRVLSVCWVEISGAMRTLAFPGSSGSGPNTKVGLEVRRVRGVASRESAYQ